MTAENDFSSLRHAWYQSLEGRGFLDGALHLTKVAISPWHRRGHCILQMGFDHGKSLELLWQSGFDVSAVCSSESLLDTLEAPLRQCVDIEYRSPAAFDNLSYGDKSFDYVIVSLPPAEAEKPYPPLQDVLCEALRIAAKGVLVQSWNACSLVGMQHRWRKASLPIYMQKCSWYTWQQIYTTLRALHPQQRGTFVSTLRTYSSLWGSMSLWKSRKPLHESEVEKSSFNFLKMPKITLPLPLGALMCVRLTFKDQGVMTNMPLYVSSLGRERLQPASVTERTSKRMVRQGYDGQSTHGKDLNNK